MSNTVLGYSIAGIGIIILALSYTAVRKMLSLGAIPGLSDSTLMIIGLVIIVVGVVLAFNKSSSSKQEEEVPIYEGEGKNRRIVAYKKMGKK